jgi:hypothetical protein
MRLSLYNFVRINGCLSVYNTNGLNILGGSMMKIDFDFVRNFLLAVEREATNPISALTKEQLGFSNFPDGIFGRQVTLLARSGLLDTIIQKSEQGSRYFAANLTKAGMEFLDEIRDEQVWQRILSIHTEEVETISLSVLIALAQRVVELKEKKEKRSDLES